MTTYIGSIEHIKNHTVDLSHLYLKEGSVVLVSNELDNVWALYERSLPDEDYWATYTVEPRLEEPEHVTPHDVIHITREHGFCKIFFNPDDQERECAEKDKVKK